MNLQSFEASFHSVAAQQYLVTRTLWTPETGGGIGGPDVKDALEEISTSELSDSILKMALRQSFIILDTLFFSKLMLF